jgi:hypothetical protein
MDAQVPRWQDAMERPFALSLFFMTRLMRFAGLTASYPFVLFVRFVVTRFLFSLSDLCVKGFYRFTTAPKP